MTGAVYFISYSPKFAFLTVTLVPDIRLLSLLRFLTTPTKNCACWSFAAAILPYASRDCIVHDASLIAGTFSWHVNIDVDGLNGPDNILIVTVDGKDVSRYCPCIVHSPDICIGIFILYLLPIRELYSALPDTSILCLPVDDAITLNPPLSSFVPVGLPYASTIVK